MTDIFAPPPGKSLIPFQEEDVAKAYLTLVEGGGAVELQHEMGLGKTVLSIAVASLMFEDDLIDKVLVVAEANKVRDWAEDDFPSWSRGLNVMRYQGTPTRRKNIREKHDPDVLVMTYETGRNDIAVFEKATRKEGRAIKGPGPLAEWVAGKRLLIVFDECFVAGTPVDTPDGPRNIEDLAVGDVVLNATGEGRVVRTITKTSSVLIQVSVAGKTLHCSPRHPFFTARGLVRAEDLTEGDLLCERDEALRLVQGGPFEAQGNPVLFESLLGAVAGDAEWNGQWQGLHSGPTNPAPRGCREDKSGAQGQRVASSYPGWERKGSDCPPGSAHESLGQGVDSRTPGGRRQGELASRDAQELLHRHRLHQTHGGSGGGRPVALNPVEEGVGPQEGQVSGFARVDRVQVLEPGSPDFDRLSGGSDQVTLYDLEVENHHSFSVDGILVHNCTKLRNRTNRLHLSWNFLINSYLVKKSWKVNGPKPYLMGLTGTKIESRPEDHYNVNRILASDVSPTVEQFENAYVAEWDKWSNTPSAWKNLSDATTEPGVVSLASLYSHMTIRRRKQDPEVIDWFPKKVENPSRYIQMGKAQEDFYWAVVEALDEDNPLAGMSALRQIANTPAALLRSQGELAKTIVEIVGSNTLRQMGSAKTDAMVNWAYEADDQQMVIFTFYGQSVLPVLHDRLREEGYSVSINHGQMTGKARQDSQNAYKAGETQIFLTSDAGARGLNLGVGSALLHYELPPLAAIYHQRSDRIHRADSTHPSVTVDSLITADTVDDLIVNMMLRRDGWQDAIVDNDRHSSEATEAGYLNSEDRRALWAAARKKPVSGR